MSTNKYEDHIHVLPEDEADSELASGFLLDHAVAARVIQVLPYAGGWSKVLDSFEADHIAGMRQFPKRRIVLVLDFDETPNRRQQAENRIPSDLKDRVFLIGCWTDPQALKRSCSHRPLESIGLDLAEDCRKDTSTAWDHEQLQHNAAELKRMRQALKPILFPSV
jgi:hypothetical protein